MKRSDMVLKIGDFAAADVALTQLQWTKFGEYVCNAGEVVGVGRGKLTSMTDSIGRMYVRLCSAQNTPIRGLKMRIVYETAQDQPITVIGEYDVDILALQATNRADWYPFPDVNMGVSEDKKICIYIWTAGANNTVDVSESTMYIDGTRQYV